MQVEDKRCACEIDDTSPEVRAGLCGAVGDYMALNEPLLRDAADALGASLRPEATTMGPGAPGAVALGQDAGQAVVGSGKAMGQARGCERGGATTWASKTGIGSGVRVVVVAGNLGCADGYVEEETTEGWGHVRSGGGLVLHLQGMGIEARLLSVKTKGRSLAAASPPSEAPQGDFTCADSRAAASGLKAAAWSTAHAAVLTEVAQSRASVVHVACPATPAGLLLQWVRSPLVVSEADALAVLSEVAPAPAAIPAGLLGTEDGSAPCFNTPPSPPPPAAQSAAARREVGAGGGRAEGGTAHCPSAHQDRGRAEQGSGAGRLLAQLRRERELEVSACERWRLVSEQTLVLAGDACTTLFLEKWVAAPALAWDALVARNLLLPDAGGQRTRGSGQAAEDTCAQRSPEALPESRGATGSEALPRDGAAGRVRRVSVLHGRVVVLEHARCAHMVAQRLVSPHLGGAAACVVFARWSDCGSQSCGRQRESESDGQPADAPAAGALPGAGTGASDLDTGPTEAARRRALSRFYAVLGEGKSASMAVAEVNAAASRRDGQGVRLVCYESGE